MNAEPTTIASLLSSIALKEVVLNSSILTVVIRVAWAVASDILARVRQFRMRKAQTYTIPLGPYHPEFEGQVEFYCLLIRYGTDSYIRFMASDTEKYDGRLQNRVIPISVSRQGEAGAQFEIRLPVHRRIGTQFKCFAEAKDPSKIPWLEGVLAQCDRVHDVSRSSSQFRNRLYFLLSDFGTTETVDEITNNMCFPQ